MVSLDDFEQVALPIRPESLLTFTVLRRIDLLSIGIAHGAGDTQEQRLLHVAYSVQSMSDQYDHPFCV
jgi:hypothetical protein